MTIVHNHLIRILNCIYQQAPFVSLPQDITDFVVFVHTWVMLIHEHHRSEEKFFFPWIEEHIGIKGYMEPNVEQHHAFEPGMKELEAYITALRLPADDPQKEIYSGQKIRSIIDGFGGIITDHLKDEIAFLEKLEEFGDKIDWEDIGKRVGKHAVDHAETDFVVPLMVTNADNTWEQGIHAAYWPPWPWFVGLIFRYVHVPKHKEVWRFSCSDAGGNPRDLAFLGTAEEVGRK